MLLSDYITQVQFLVHDSTSADFSVIELTRAINNARTAVSLDFHCVRQLFVAPPNNAPISPLYTPVSVIRNVEAYPLSAANGSNGQIVGAAVAVNGANYTPATTVTFPAPPTGGVQATAVPVLTQPQFIASIVGTVMTVTSKGSIIPLINGMKVTGIGVTPATSIVNQLTSTEPGGVLGGAGTYTITPSQSVASTQMFGGAALTSIYMTQWGQGYAPALPGTSGVPAVTIADSGGGTGASATAVMFNNVFNVISISYIWGNQRYMLKFRGWTLFQAYMRSLLTFTQRALIWSIHEQTGTVFIQPPPDQPYVSEWDVLALPLPLGQSVLGTAEPDTQIVPPWSDAVQYYAAMLCLNKLQNFEQAEYYLRLYSARVPKIIIGAGGVRIPNPYHRTFQRRVAR